MSHAVMTVVVMTIVQITLFFMAQVLIALVPTIPIQMTCPNDTCFNETRPINNFTHATYPNDT